MMAQDSRSWAPRLEQDPLAGYGSSDGQAQVCENQPGPG
jgi:hypothetical protein